MTYRPLSRPSVSIRPSPAGHSSGSGHPNGSGHSSGSGHPNGSGHTHGSGHPNGTSSPTGSARFPPLSRPRHAAGKTASVSDADTRLSGGQVLFCIFSSFLFLLILRNAKAAAEDIGKGLSLCAGTVIPSVFPFMVLSEWLVRSGVGEAIGCLFSRVVRRLFGLSGAGVTAVILGSMCGFPVGAKTAVSLYDHRRISRSECEHLLTFTCNPSSAFLITAVGESLFGCRRFGLILYTVVLSTSLVIGFTARFLLREKPSTPALSSVSPSRAFARIQPMTAGLFTSSVSSAASAMLHVCAYVIFFSALSGVLRGVSESFGHLNPTVYACLCGLLEMSGGIGEAARLSDRKTALILTSAVAGWSGFSVHSQIVSLCSGRPLSLRPYFLAKTVQGLLCALIMALLVQKQGVLLSPTTDIPSAAETLFRMGHSLKATRPPVLLTHALFLTGWILLLLNGRSHRSGERPV